MKSRAMLFGALMAVSAGAHAQGVVSFDDVPIEREPTVEVNMGPEMVAIFAPAARGAAGEAASALDGVSNIRVLVYEGIDEDLQEVLRFVDSTATKLENDGWHAVVRVREDDEQVRVYMKPGAGGTLSGITVMITNDGGDGGSGEATFINVAGTIQPEQLGRIASGIGMNGAFSGVPGIVGQGGAYRDTQDD